MTQKRGGAANHIHRYKKVNLSRQKGKEYWVYRCVKPVCSHYIPVSLSEGKMCECNRCGGAMLITRQVLTGSNHRPMAKPHCSSCIERKGNADIAAIADFVTGNKV